jgi:RNA polymerase sigma-70 factor (ECF subfamily)
MNMIRRIPKPSMKDEQIIKSILNGNKNDYELLMRRYNERLYRMGIYIIKNEEETEDAMQETYIKAYQQLDKFKGQSQFSTWLSRIMINESLAKIKKKKHLAEYSETEDDSQDQTVQPAMAFNSETPEKELLQKELHNILEDAIRLLPQKYQTVFMMREIEKMSINETAECLKITNENVKVRLHRAKELIKDNLRFYTQGTEMFPFHLTRCDRIVKSVLTVVQNIQITNIN